MGLLVRTPKASSLAGLKQRKKAALERGLWELFRHLRCRSQTYFGGVDAGAAGLGAVPAGFFAAGALAGAGAGTPDCTL